MRVRRSSSSNRIEVTRWRWLWLIAAAVVTAAFLPSASNAAQVAGSTDYLPFDGPRLAGDRLVWIDHSPDGSYQLEEQRIGAQRSSVLFGAQPFRIRRVRAFGAYLETSGEEVLLSHEPSSRTRPKGTFRVFEDGALQRLGPARCVTCQDSGPRLDISGSMAIYPASRRGAAEIRDLADATSEPIVVDGARDHFRIAGRYAAWESALDGDIVVYDHVQRSEAYRVPGALRGADFGTVDLTSLDLQADGKVAFSTGDGLQPLGWASPAEPYVHRLPVRSFRPHQVKLHGDVVVFLRFEARFVEGLGGRFGVLGAVPLGGEARVLARAVESDGRSAYFDFDGHRVAWQERTCSGARVVTEELGVLLARPRLRRLPRCRLRLTQPAEIVRGGRRARLRFDCRTMYWDRCAVRELVLRTLRPYQLGGRRVSAGTRINTPSGTNSRFAYERRVLLTRLGRRLVATRDQLRLGMVGILEDGYVFQRRRGRITLRG